MTRGALEAHYRLERSLADQLRAANKDQRRSLYRTVYDRLQRESPLYAEKRGRDESAAKARTVERLFAFVRRFFSAESVVVEIGAGDAALSRRIAPGVREIIAIDVSREALPANIPEPPNLRFLLTDGFGLPVPDGSIDLALSNQLMEHLHPDDAFEQLESIFRALKPGGRYVCITPNRLNGPHDVSKHFDPVATCLHLKEYTAGELADVFARAGFVELRVFAGTKGRFLSLPIAPVRLLEKIVGLFPAPLRRALAKFWPIRAAIGIRLSGTKPTA